MKTKYNILAFLLIGVLGTVGHFVYEWSGNSRLIGCFFATNESTWEHLKLLFFPTVIYSVIEYIFVQKEIKNYIPAVIISVISGMLAIVTLFYTYQGVIGKNIDFLNISIYYIAIIVMLFVKTKVIDSERLSNRNWSLIFLLIGVLIAFLFLIFTYSPPNLNIFSEPKILK